MVSNGLSHAAPCSKSGSLVLLIIGSLGIDLIQHVYRLLGHAATFADFKPVISLAVIVLLVLLYKSLCTKR